MDQVSNIVRGGSPRPIQDYLTEDSSGINWVKIGDADRGSKVISSCKEKIRPEGIKRSRFIRKGSLLLTNSMSYGYPYILNVDGCIHDGWLAFFDFDDYFDIDFLYYVLLSPFCKTQFTNTAAGAVVKNLNINKVRKILVPVPPIEEQQRITKKLECLFDLVQQTEKSYIDLQNLSNFLKKIILQQAIQGELVPQLESEPVVTQIGEALKDIPFMIPTKWKWVTLGAISKKIHYGYTASAKEKGNARLLRITDIQNESVNWSSVPFCSPSDKEITKFKLNAGDIVIARTGGTIGKSYLISDEIEKTTVFASYLIRVIPEVGYVDPAYLQAFLRSPCYWGQLIDGSRGTGQPNVNAQALSEIKVPLPSIQEQHRIVQKLKELSDKVEITT